MKKNHSPLSPLLLAAVIAAWAAWAPAPARGGEAVSHLEELENMDPAAKEKFLAKKVKEVDGMSQAQVGRYVVRSAFGAESAYYWGAVLDEFTDEALDEGVVPKKVKKMTRNPPTVYILKDQQSYAAMLKQWEINAPDWSTGLFTYSPKAKGPMLFVWKYTPNEGEMRTTVLHEATHQLLYYHVSRTGVPQWFNEGFATNLETYDACRRLKANLYYDVFVSNHANSLTSMKRSDVIPFSRLVNVTNEQWNTAPKDRANANYFSAWLTVNYFFTTKEGRKTVTKLLAAYANNAKAPSLPVKAIDEQIGAHLEKTVIPCLKYGRLAFFILEGRIDEARRAMDVAGIIRKKNGDDMGVLREWIGELERHRDDEQARTALAEKIQKAMLKEFPGNPEGLLYEAWIKLRQDGGDAAKAGQVAESVTKLLKANPDFYHPAHNYVLAEAYFRAGQLAKAKEALAKAVRDNRKHPATLELKKAIKEKETATAK